MDREDFEDTPWERQAGFGGHFGKMERMQMFQARRGDIKLHILKALTHRPMHGYEIMGWIEEKSHGMWRPSPGSVYPTLQLLEDEDLVSVLEEDGKKIYKLTEAGEKAAEKAKEDRPWHGHKHFKHHKEFGELVRSNITIIKKLMRQGDEQKIAELIDALQTFNQSLRKISEDQ
jgi:DNA-binding PadR family transcriptional regulator